MGWLQAIFGRRQSNSNNSMPLPEQALDEHAPFDHMDDEQGLVHLALAPAADDPLLAYLQESEGVTEVRSLRLESPTLQRLREAGVQMIVPLISQGELLGMINLGPRRSNQEYSNNDKRLLAELADRAAPSVRVAQLVRQQRIETRELERIESELRVARIIQEMLLPKQLPDLRDYTLSAYWQPARAVGGDFYDFVQLENGKLALIIGDVTDKGVPAALVMSTTRTVLRSAAERHQHPSAVLRRANEVLCPDIPPKMFITCLYAVLDPATGVLRYANAGHDLPYLRRANPDGPAVEEMRATGMPLGMLPGMQYEEKEIVIEPGDTILFYSDGLVEAHNPQRDMFSFRRLRGLVGEHAGGADIVPFLLDKLAEFTGAGWEQEDDVTIVTLQRNSIPVEDVTPAVAPQSAQTAAQNEDVIPESERTQVAAFTISSAEGNEREAMRRVAAAVANSGLTPGQIERLKTAVAEATMNAMEHGNQYNAQLLVNIVVSATPDAIYVSVTDRGGGRPVPPAVQPNIDAKLAGLQSPRGWGLFLIESMVDKVTSTNDEVRHTVELMMRLQPDAQTIKPTTDAA